MSRTGDSSDGVFLGDDPKAALSPFTKVQTEMLFPFLEDWWQAAGLQDKDKKAARKLPRYAKWRSARLPNGYSWLPGFLNKIANGMKFTRRNFINIHPSPYLPSILASLAATIQNPNNIVEEVSGPTTEMERECIEWLARDFMGFDPVKAWGSVVSGGTVGNLTALLVARDYTYGKLSRPRNHDIGERGVIGRAPGVVLTTAGAHYSLKKALWVLGIGHENLIQVPVAWDETTRAHQDADERFIKGMTDSRFRSLIMTARDAEMGRNELQKFYDRQQRPFSLRPLDSEIYKALYSCFTFNVPLLACVFSAGTTFTATLESLDSGAVKMLRDEDIHIHVDAALGGFALALPEVRKRVQGLELADSVTIDGHKLGMLPYPNAAVLFRDQSSRQQILHDAPYLRGLAPTIEGSRPGSHVAGLWAAKESIGTAGYQAWIRKILDFTQAVAKAIEATGEFQVLHEVHLNTVAFAPLPLDKQRRTEVNRLCELIKKRFEKESIYLLNTEDKICGIKVLDELWRRDQKDTPLVDITALRLVVSSPLVQNGDIEDLTKRLCRHLAEARTELRKSNQEGD